LTRLEDALSRALAERANAPAPDVADLAERAIAAGRAQRRLRFGSAAAALVCMAVAASVLATVQAPRPQHRDIAEGYDAPPRGEPVAVSSPVPPSVPDLPVDYVSDNQLNLRSGRTVKLPTGNWTQVQRAPDGFVAVEDDPSKEQRAWFVPERTGIPVMLVEQARSIAVANDGSGRLAWLSGQYMYYREINFVGTVYPLQWKTLQTERPSTGRPVGIAGDAVILADSGPDIVTRHDLWFPAKGGYEPTWASFFAVYGIRARGTELVVARYTDKKRVCLEIVQVETLKPDDRYCHFVDRAPTNGWVSSSGRWLVVADQRQAQVFDLSAGWRRSARVAWAVNRVDTYAAWLDQDTVALHTSSGVVVLAPLGVSKATEYKLPPQSVIVSQ
jgi:hypothetical protein